MAKSVKVERRCRDCGQVLSRYNEGERCGVCALSRRDGVPAMAFIPPSIWFEPVMRAALAEWDWATVLSSVATETGVSQLQLADLTGFSQSHVSRLMKGRAQCYDIRAISRMIDGLGAPRSFAGLAPAIGTDGVTVPLDQTEEVAPMLRRTLLAATLAIPATAVLGPMREARAITHGHAVKVRGLLPELYKLDDQTGGSAVSDITLWCLREVDTLLNHSEYAEAAGRELLLAYGELAEMAGWLEFDAGRTMTAQYQFGEALRAAQLADDLNLEVLILASMIMLARGRGRPREAVQLSQLAQRRASGWGTTRLMSLLAAREAIGWAQAGDSAAAQSAMNRALHTFDPNPAADDPAWLSFYTAAELLALQSSVSSYLERSAQAVTQLRMSLQALDPGYQRNRALYSARLALAHLVEGDDRSACATLSGDLALFTKVRSGRALAHLGECLAAVGQRRAPYASDLVQRARSYGLVGAA